MTTTLVHSRNPPLGVAHAAAQRSPIAPETFDAACAHNREVLGSAGNEAFRAGTLSADGLARLMAVTLPHWRPARARPHKGHLFLNTARGGLRLTYRHLVDFYAVEADVPEQHKVSARSIQRMLQVVGAAYHAAQGEAVKVEAMLLELLDEDGRTTPAGLLRTARRKAPWAACLCRDRSPEAQRRRFLARFRSSLDEGAWSLVALEEFQAEVAAAVAELREEEAGNGQPTVLNWPARPRPRPIGGRGGR